MLRVTCVTTRQSYNRRGIVRLLVPDGYASHPSAYFDERAHPSHAALVACTRRGQARPGAAARGAPQQPDSESELTTVRAPPFVRSLRPTVGHSGAESGAVLLTEWRRDWPEGSSS